MFSFKKILGLIAIFGLLFTLTPNLLRAQEIPSGNNTGSNVWLRFVNLRVAPGSTTAKIYWTTNFPTTGYFKFGLTNGFGNWSEDKKQDTYHETTLSSLKDQQTYYFQILATDPTGRQIKSDIYSFTTSKEDDHLPPTISNVHINYISGNSVTISWETDEYSNSCIHYGLALETIKNKSCKASSSTKIHDLTTKNLTTDTLYYYQVSSTDKAGNIQYSVTRTFKTNSQNDKNLGDLVIYELSPFNRKTSGDLNSSIINVKTNRPVEGYISYGTKSNTYKNRVTLAWPRNTDTDITLPDLMPNQMYYYRLYLTDVLGKKLNSPEYSFVTLSQNILTQKDSANFSSVDGKQDFDQDGLSYDQEIIYGTDPLKPDTDGDSYLDGIEVFYGYNPLGPGRLNEAKKITGPYYGKPRLSSLATEQKMASELSVLLKQYNIKRPSNNSPHWYTLVNAYIYGNYPVKAIAQAVKFGGKTVHPSIPWETWKTAPDYLNYIDR